MENILKGKKIILGVTGSIAAYKATLIVRELVKSGAEVNVVMTPASTKFIAPLTLESLSRNNVVVEMFSDIKQTGGAWHVQLAQWADLMIIAPCSASTLSKIANGQSDTALVCVAMAMPKEKPLLISPAMDYDMWLHPATQNNVKLLESYDAIVIPPAEGELASGLSGPGRLPDIPVLIDYIKKSLANPLTSENVAEKPYSPFDSSIESLNDAIDKDKWTAEMELERLKNNLKYAGNDLSGKKVLITAGPTIERIDDVRFISNHSTGKMGYAIAKAASEAGAEVTLISGPVNIAAPEKVRTINVESAQEMFEIALNLFNDCDIAIMTAAVADFTPETKHEGKLKKDSLGENVQISLVRTKDILAELGNRKQGQILVGFALESENVIENARKKLFEKNCDLIIANKANVKDSGFGGDNNTITIIDRHNNETSYAPMPKELAAKEIIAKILVL